MVIVGNPVDVHIEIKVTENLQTLLWVDQNLKEVKICKVILVRNVDHLEDYVAVGTVQDEILNHANEQRTDVQTLVNRNVNHKGKVWEDPNLEDSEVFDYSNVRDIDI